MFKKRTYKEFADVSLPDSDKLQRECERNKNVFAVSAIVVMIALVMTIVLVHGEKSNAEMMAEQIQDKKLKIAVINKGK